MKNDIKVYIRHCGERTVPVLEWFFRDFDIELINGLNRRFADVLEDMFLKIKDQDQRFALVLDGDLVPVVSIDEMVRLFIEPLYIKKNLVTLNGNMVGKFFTMDRAMTGGVKSYNKSRIDLYLRKLDKTQQRPESYIYRKSGYFAHLRTNKPQVGHEYGQFLWHIHEKAVMRGVKATKEIRMRKGNDIDFTVFRKAYNNGRFLRGNHMPCIYKKENLPKEYLESEKESIAPDKAENEYLKLKEEIISDIQHDIGNVIDQPLEVMGIEEVKSPLLHQIANKFTKASR